MINIYFYCVISTNKTQNLITSLSKFLKIVRLDSCLLIIIIS